MQIGTETTAQALHDELAPHGASMLVDILKNGTYIDPKPCEPWYQGNIAHAPKITKEDRKLDLATHSLKQVIRIQNALGDPWCVLPNGDRVILHSVASGDMRDMNAHRKPGLYVQQDTGEILLKAPNGKLGIVNSSTYQGRKAGQGNGKLAAVLPVRTWGGGEE